MRIVLAGGSGFIGRKLIEKLSYSNHTITLLSRSANSVEGKFAHIRVEFWDGKSPAGLTKIIDGADALINLAGESISSGRWTSKKKERILKSRIESTRALVSAIELAKHKPSTVLNASAVGFYGNVPEGEVSEGHPRGNGFLSDVCEQWEAEALRAEDLGVRVVLLRTGVVLDASGGAFPRIALPFRFMIGGHLGSGKQWFPWIHLVDEVNAILFALENERISGPLNLVAPEPLPMKEFCKTLGKLIHRPSWLPIPEIALRILLGEMAGPLLLEGQCVVPRKLINHGFKFQFSKLEDALIDILD